MISCWHDSDLTRASLQQYALSGGDFSWRSASFSKIRDLNAVATILGD